MSPLTLVSLIAGGALIAVLAPAVLMPATARTCCERFPRSAVAAWVLVAIDLAWAAALLYYSPILAGMVWAQRLAVVLAPVAFVLIVFLLDELLAARALGGLLVLLPRPILDAAFVNDSGWKLVMTLFAYALAIAGITLILSPFYFRKCAGFLLKTNSRSRITGMLGVGLGAAMIALALTMY